MKGYYDPVKKEPKATAATLDLTLRNQQSKHPAKELFYSYVRAIGTKINDFWIIYQIFCDFLCGSSKLNAIKRKGRVNLGIEFSILSATGESFYCARRRLKIFGISLQLSIFKNLIDA